MKCIAQSIIAGLVFCGSLQAQSTTDEGWHWSYGTPPSAVCSNTSDGHTYGYVNGTSPYLMVYTNTTDGHIYRWVNPPQTAPAPAPNVTYGFVNSKPAVPAKPMQNFTRNVQNTAPNVAIKNPVMVNNNSRPSAPISPQQSSTPTKQAFASSGQSSTPKTNFGPAHGPAPTLSTQTTPSDGSWAFVNGTPSAGGVVKYQDGATYGYSYAPQQAAPATAPNVSYGFVNTKPAAPAPTPNVTYGFVNAKPAAPAPTPNVTYGFVNAQPVASAKPTQNFTANVQNSAPNVAVKNPVMVNNSSGVSSPTTTKQSSTSTKQASTPTYNVNYGSVPTTADSTKGIVLDSAVSTVGDMVGAVSKYYAAGGTKGVPVEFSPITQETIQPALPSLAFAATVTKNVLPFASAAYSGVREYQKVSNTNLSGEEKAAHIIFSSSLSLAASAVSVVNPYLGAAVALNYSASEDYLYNKIVEQPGNFLGSELYNWAPGLFK